MPPGPDCVARCEWTGLFRTRDGGLIGGNAQQRVEVSAQAVPGARHVIACLVANGPLAEPRGGIWMRYATLAFESPN